MRETRQSGSTRRLWVIPELYSIIPDVVRLKRTVESIRKLIPGIEIILDSGFFSNENLILLKDDSYIIGASLVLKTVKNGLFSASRTVDSSDNVNMYQNGPIFCNSVNFTINDLDLDGYFYHDPRRESDERSAVEKLQTRPNVREIIASMASTYLRYFT